MLFGKDESENVVVVENTTAVHDVVAKANGWITRFGALAVTLSYVDLFSPLVWRVKTVTESSVRQCRRLDCSRKDCCVEAYNARLKSVASHRPFQTLLRSQLHAVSTVGIHLCQSMSAGNRRPTQNALSDMRTDKRE